MTGYVGPGVHPCLSPEFPEQAPFFNLAEDVVCAMEGLEGPERKLRDGSLVGCQLGNAKPLNVFPRHPNTS